MWYKYSSNQNVPFLYHCTSVGNAISILKSGVFNPGKGGYISFSSNKFNHDINAGHISLKINFGCLSNLVEKVDYTEEWFNENEDKSLYVSGEGWVEQFEYSPEIEGEFPDQELMEQEFHDAQINSFLSKSEENEWISVERNSPIQINIQCVVTALVRDQDIYNDAFKFFQLNQINVPIVLNK